MRNFIIWTLSFLVGFEPALMAQGNAKGNAEIKTFIEMSGLSQHPVTFKELYNKFSAYLPMAQKDELKSFISTYGDVKIPKMDVSKIKGSGGDEVYKLQVVDNGQSASIEFFNEAKQFARVNGQVVTADDMKSVAAVMAKAGVPAEVAAVEFKRPVHHSMLLMAEDITKLKQPDQAVYFKDYRNLLSATEAAQTANLNAKNHSALNDSFGGKYEVIAHWLRGEEAFALGTGDDCTAAGYSTTKVVLENGKRLACGGDGKGAVPEEYRHKADGSGSCDIHSFACNPVVYGEKAGSQCVPAGKDTTRICNDFAVRQPHGDVDIPDLAKNKEKFDENAASAEAAIQAVLATCDSIDKEGGDASSSGKKPSKKTPNGLISDQVETCKQARLRAATIKSWDCSATTEFRSKKSFKDNYPQLCKEKESRENQPTPPPAAGASGQPPASPGQPAPSGDPVSCSTFAPQFSTSPSCSGGKETHPGTSKFPGVCVDSSGKKWDGTTIYECICKDGTPAMGKKCDGSNSIGDTAGGSGGKKEKSFFEKNKQWIILLGAGLAGLLVYHYMAKQQVSQAYDYLQPAPAAKPPVVAPPSIPVPRATQ